MSDTKTGVTAVDPADFIATVEPPAKREAAKLLDAMFRRVTGTSARMWGPSIVGYGSYHYRYDSGREGRSCRLGFSPRKARISLYLLGSDGDEAHNRFAELLARLGQHKRAVACVYVNRLADIDMGVLEEIAALSWQRSLEIWPED